MRKTMQINSSGKKSAYSAIVAAPAMAFDSFVNPTLSLGMGGGNALSHGGFVNTVTANFQWLKLRSMYTSNWLARRLVEMQAEDMTRAGVQYTGSIEPEKIKKMQAAWAELSIGQTLFETICMARLYGGAIAYIDISGQPQDTPLDIRTVSKGQFLGLKMFDRWQLFPSYDDFSPIDGLPNYYTVLSPYDFDMKFSSLSDINKLSQYATSFKIHRSRVVRCDGDFLPYIDFLQNQRWYSSVLVNAMDVITNYLTASAALASAAYKSSIRVVKVANLYEVINQGKKGEGANNLLKLINVMKLTESTENVTVIDREDSIEILNYDLNGLMMSLDQFERQISSLSGAPATKLLGETAKGLNATGDNETRMYYDKVNAAQQRIRPAVFNVLKIIYASTFGEQPPEDFNFDFTPLWQLDENQKAVIAQQDTDSIDKAFSSGLASKALSLKELLQSSEKTGVWSNITEEDIAKAELEDAEPPAPAADPIADTDLLKITPEKTEVINGENT